MSERGYRIAQRFEWQVEQMATIVSALSADDLLVRCQDPQASTIGGVVAHLRDGTNDVVRWAETTVPRIAGPAGSAQIRHSDGHAHGHVHHDTHPHDHEPGPGTSVVTLAERDEVVANMSGFGRALATAVREMTDAQLDACPPAAPGLTDGTPLHQVMVLMTDDLASHLRHVKVALAGRPTTAPAGQVKAIATLLADPATMTDPYPVYDAMRELDPVLWLPKSSRWLITGHPEAVSVLGHSQVSVNRTLSHGDGTPTKEDRRFRALPQLDPPDHTRLRGLVQKAFSARGVQQLGPHIEGLVDSMLNEVAEQGEMDLVKDFAGPLPAMALACLLGIPPGDQEQFRHWVTTVIETIDPVSFQLVSDHGAMDRAAMYHYFAKIIARRRKHPENDLISAMIHAEEAGDQLTAKEILDMCTVLTMAGLDSVTSLIANGMCALLDDLDQLARLRHEGDLMKTAVEELLRFDSPIQVSGRIVIDDFELGGHTLTKGQTVGVVFGAANRDPRVFADPARLDITRWPNPHLGLGRGIHFCIGAPLLRLEAAIGLAALIERFPRLHRIGEAKTRRNLHVRGFESLPVSLT